MSAVPETLCVLCCVNDVGSFQPSYSMMLTFYALYKQATNGPCTVSRPYVWDVVGRAKWYGTVCCFTVYLHQVQTRWQYFYERKWDTDGNRTGWPWEKEGIVKVCNSDGTIIELNRKIDLKRWYRIEPWSRSRVLKSTIRSWHLTQQQVALLYRPMAIAFAWGEDGRGDANAATQQVISNGMVGGVNWRQLSTARQRAFSVCQHNGYMNDQLTDWPTSGLIIPHCTESSLRAWAVIIMVGEVDN